MDITDRLYVEIHPFPGPQPPVPHPVDHARFDPALIYKVLGMYNPSETSECYFVLANPQRQIWFIPQRHLLAYGLVDSDDMFLSKADAEAIREKGHRPAADLGISNGEVHLNGFTDKPAGLLNGRDRLKR